MLMTVYDIIMTTGAIVLAPYFLVGALFGDKKLLNNLAIFLRNQRTLLDSGRIWIHASSVGEVKAAFEIIDSLQQKSPRSKVLLTVYTPRGMAVAEQMKSDGVTPAYLPIDSWFLIARTIRLFKPSILVITETELWPGLLRGCIRASIPVCIANGRISDRSHRHYLQFRSFFAPFLRKMSFVHCQSAEDRVRFLALGGNDNSVIAGHNVKVASMLRSLREFDRRATADDLGLSESDQVFVAGSTREGEERIVLESFKSLRVDFPNLKLLLAPRHPKRVAEVCSIVSDARLKYIRRSEINSRPISEDVIVLDTLGELWKVYGIGAFAFVGGSLVPIGGHNPLEPIALGIPTCFGPYMQNAKDIAELALAKGLASEVSDAGQISEFGARCLRGDSALPDAKWIFEELGSDANMVAGRILDEIKNR